MHVIAGVGEAASQGSGSPFVMYHISAGCARGREGVVPPSADKGLCPNRCRLSITWPSPALTAQSQDRAPDSARSVFERREYSEACVFFPSSLH